ncbi:hypothetical protein [Luteibacter sp.]|uniref:hypothetical protein n=1 Tax=Luteibacter sp. TaxID=1886636 RepID=UPI0028085313|nr:hypothetical protein [Luteibacter sp.]MDQ8050741.1 hypothetical protein [Luteibacter sp.]
MPRVPQAQNTVNPTINPSARSNAGITPEAFGAGIGRGLQQVGGAVVSIALQEREKQDRAKLMEGERQLQQWQNQTLFAPTTGAFAQRGQNAFGVIDRVMPEWDKQVGEVEAGMTDRQKAVFRERAQGMRTTMERDLMRHVGSEAERYQSQETTALVTTRAETAMLYWEDEARFDKEMREAQGVFLAGNPGLPPAALKLGLTEIESKLRTQKIDKLVEQDPRQAQRYYDSYKDVMTEADRERAERVLKPAMLDSQAQDEVDRATGRAVAGMPPPSDFTTYRRNLESGGRADAKNPESSATGADQFIESTWIETVNKAKPAWAAGLSRSELLALRTDPEKSAEMANVLAQENAAALQRAGLPVTNETLYAMHHFGRGGGIKFANAAADTPMEDILTDDQLAANGYLRGKTKAEAIANWNRRAGGRPGVAPTGEPKSKADVLATLNEIDDPQVRARAMQKYNTELDIQRVAEAERDQNISESINSKVEAAVAGTPLRQVLTPEEYAWAAEKGKVDTWEARMRQRVAGLEPVTDAGTFDALQTMMVKAENGDKAALEQVKTLDVTTLFTKLDRSARDYIQNRRSAIIEADQKKTPKLNFASEDELLNVEVFSKLGISKNAQKDDSDETKTTRFAYMQSYWAATAAKQAELGRDLTSGERQQIMRDSLLPFSRKVRDTFVGIPFERTETKRGFEIGPTPTLDRQQIISAYRSVYGVQPNEDQIRAEYLRSKGYAPRLESN